MSNFIIRPLASADVESIKKLHVSISQLLPLSTLNTYNIVDDAIASQLSFVFLPASAHS